VQEFKVVQTNYTATGFTTKGVKEYKEVPEEVKIEPEEKKEE